LRGKTHTYGGARFPNETWNGGDTAMNNTLQSNAPQYGTVYGQ